MLTVADNGIGLPAARDRLVEPYVTTRARGTGLGLAIVKKIVEEHCGTISFGDRPGGGTIVTIVLRHRCARRVARGDRDPTRGPRRARRPAALTRTGQQTMALDILIVDDERDIRELVAGVLEDEGYETRGAADSDAALEAISARRPSLVLLDVWLQGSRLDGLELLDELKQRDPSIPVLVISGHGNLDTAVAAIRRGAADFIEKPFEAERLLLMVARATETERLRREVASLRARSGAKTDLTGSSGRDQRGARHAEAGRRYRQPGADHRPGRCRQGSCRAAAARMEPAR